MPTYKITDPDTGATKRVTGGSPPTQEEAAEIFKQAVDATRGHESELREFDKIKNMPDSPSTPFSEIPQGIIDDPAGFSGKVMDELVSESPSLAGAAAAATHTAPLGPGAQIPAALGTAATIKLIQLAVEQGLLKSGVSEEGDKLISNVPLKEKSVQEISDETVQHGLLFGATEGVAPIVRALKGGERLSGAVSADQRAALDFSKKHGGPTPSLAKVTEANVPDVVENFTRAGLFAGGRFLRLEAKATEFVDSFISQIVGKNKLGAKTIGDSVLDSIQGGSKAFKEGPVKVLFGMVGKAFGESPIQVASVQSSIREVLPRLRSITQSGEGVSLIERLETIQPRLNPKTGILERVITFEEAQELRSGLLTLIRKESDLLGGKVTGNLKFIEQALEKEMINTAKLVDKAGGAGLSGVTVRGGTPISTENLFRRANDFFKKGINIFNSRLVSKMSKDSPDVVANKIVGDLSGKPVVIRKMRSAINNKETWRELQDHVLSQMVERSTKAGEVNVKALQNEFKKFGGKNGEALKQMFPDGKDKAMLKALNFKDIFLRKQPDSTGRFGSQIGQISAAQALASGAAFMTGNEKTAIGILLAPPLMAKLLTAPWFVKFMTTPAGRTANPSVFIARATALFNKHGIKDFEFVNKDDDGAQTPFSGLAEQFAQ